MENSEILKKQNMVTTFTIMFSGQFLCFHIRKRCFQVGRNIYRIKVKFPDVKLMYPNEYWRFRIEPCSQLNKAVSKSILFLNYVSECTPSFLGSTSDHHVRLWTFETHNLKRSARSLIFLFEKKFWMVWNFFADLSKLK